MYDAKSVRKQTRRLLDAIRLHHPERCMAEGNVRPVIADLSETVLVPVLPVKLADGVRKAVHS